MSLVRRALPIAGLPPALAGKSLVQLSDLHVGPIVHDDFVLGVFDDVRRLRPDIVVVTGSLFLVGEAMQRLGLATPATVREPVLQ